PLWVGERIDRHDLAVLDREGHDRERAPAWGHDDTGDAVDQRRPHVWGEPRERHRALGHGPRAVDYGGRAWAQRPAVGAQDVVGVEHRDERVEVAVAGG